MTYALRHTTVLVHEALRLIMVLGSAASLICAGRFLPL
jgi:hypothetical protein